jgi:hypothetical protein
MNKNTIQLKTVDSMPGSINELLSTNRRLVRPPSLSESFAWSEENIARANLIPLISPLEALEALEAVEVVEPIEITTEETSNDKPTSHWKYEQQTVEVFIKLLLHITLISIFETVFYFLYVSSLENNGIELTINTFIDGAVTSCENINPLQIQLIDDFLEPYINASQVISIGNNQEIQRTVYNTSISIRAWGYVGGLIVLFASVTVYVKCRKISIKWKYILTENMVMVSLLALYELMFFNTIIYPYHPISTAEIERNAVERLQASCGILL